MNASSSSMIFGLIGVAIAVPMLALGLMMLRMGRSPARRGSEPHCRACEYLLIGIKSDRCPECGAVLSEETIVHGARRRYPGLIWSGVAFIALAVVATVPLVTTWVQRTDWYPYKPTFMVMQDLDSS